MLALYSYSLPPCMQEHSVPSGFGVDERLRQLALTLTEKEFFHVASTPAEDRVVTLRPLDRYRVAVLDRNRRLIAAVHIDNLVALLTLLEPPAEQPRITESLTAAFSL